LQEDRHKSLPAISSKHLSNQTIQVKIYFSKVPRKKNASQKLVNKDSSEKTLKNSILSGKTYMPLDSSQEPLSAVHAMAIITTKPRLEH
jgi:hypothetical protein